MVLATGCSCLFETMMESHYLQEYNTDSELRVVRRMITTEESRSKATFRQSTVGAGLLCSGLRGEAPERGLEKMV